VIPVVLAIVGLFLAGGPQAPPRPAQSTTEIRGRVVDKETGRPLSGAMVSLVRENGDSQKTSFTDEAGVFRFSALEPGRYWGHVTAGRFRGNYATQSLFAPPGNIVDIAKDEVRQVVVALPRAYAIPVRVLDEAGTPLSDIRLKALDADSGNMVSMSIDHMTDDQGRMRMFGVQPGRYHVCAESWLTGSTGTDKPLPTCYPSAENESGAKAITIDRGDLDEIDIRMRRGRTYAISALVLDSTGAVARTARVSLNKYDATSSSGVGMLRQDDGRFRSAKVPAGRYAIEASLGGDEQPEERRPLERAFVPVTVDADSADVTVTLRRTIDVPGRFVTEDPSAELPPSPGSGLSISSRFTENMLPVVTNGSPAYMRKDRTFTLSELFGRRVLSAHNLPRGWYAKAIRYNGVDVTGQTVDFDRVREPGQLEVVLSTRGAILTGRVLDDLGNPVPKATVVVMPVGQQTTPFVPALPASADGFFRFGPARAGEYVVFALPVNKRLPALDDPERLARLIALGERVTLGELDERTLDLHVIKER
jgi:protocatechuate 3,4-dioxygenase beta subunit